MSRTSTRDTLLELQRRWAEDANIAIDGRGYVASYTANLWKPLSPTAKASFDLGSGSELWDGKTRPAKMRALHSSSALAVNVFDYWSVRDSTPMLEALEIGTAIEPPHFEAQFPTGLEGKPPNLDIAIRLASGITFAIESKYCEWLTPKSKSQPPFKAKYFAPVPDLWRRAGLPECQGLADDVQGKVEPFVHLDVPQLLKHALGLATNLKQHFSLCYLYYDWPSPEFETHQLEVDRFSARVGRELRFRAITYQTLFRQLTQKCGVRDDEYTGYLRSRYFRNAA